jgi:hypothetical protein
LYSPIAKKILVRVSWAWLPKLIALLEFPLLESSQEACHRSLFRIIPKSEVKTRTQKNNQHAKDNVSPDVQGRFGRCGV